MAKFIVTATYSNRENYGAHTWDGTGTCPQHWKNKGNMDKVIAEITLEQYNRLGTLGLRTMVMDRVGEHVEDNEYYQIDLVDWEMTQVDDLELRRRVRTSIKKQSQFWGSNDPYLYMAVADELRIPEPVAQQLMAA